METTWNCQENRHHLANLLNSHILQPPAPLGKVQAMQESLYGEHRKGFVCEIESIMEDAFPVAQTLFTDSMDQKFLPVLLGLDTLKEEDWRSYHDWIDVCLWTSQIWRDSLGLKRNCNQFGIWLTQDHSGNAHARRFVHQHYRRIFHTLHSTKECLARGPLQIFKMSDKENQVIHDFSGYIEWSPTETQLKPNDALSRFHQLCKA